MPKSQKDVRKQQIPFLRYEKQVMGSVATLAVACTAAAQAADKNLDGEALKALASIKEAQLHLIQTITESHQVLHAKAVNIGALMVDGGRPTNDPPALLEYAKSLLGF